MSPQPVVLNETWHGGSKRVWEEDSSKRLKQAAPGRRWHATVRVSTDKPENAGDRRIEQLTPGRHLVEARLRYLFTSLGSTQS